LGLCRLIYARFNVYHQTRHITMLDNALTVSCTSKQSENMSWNYHQYQSDTV